MPRVFKMGPYLVYFWSGESEPDYGRHLGEA